MTDIREYRAWIRALTKLSDASIMMENTPFLGIDPDIKRELNEIWNKMDGLKHRMVRRIEDMEFDLEEKSGDEE